ncbi:GtrA family protein [Mesorhizobium sp. M2D.F.Ca.ET.185.01.1.1]|uniref:GtrA family protein n=1 Tax=unclassified Mesorhizobium TaxID=325217 RepID=UPI000FCACA73|nr:MULTISPECIES: GtrA family protein [unclassified Mesorhizobium]TGP81883.1 GtrA family protein [bacterium M00.F.Ca.ET.227.01.1.1]TGP86150.1 GtrA family protein [bacterium M00.F.Ca.ET.222.01.1.1]TGP92225.1 GtrA family protein [bacterium M00.F.Ca.ET.221.01.1.1]TGU09904.1 GtrA family protein [bacterium M00.F.Ca.ET.163.01.1.1]TGU39089.1 GtrA family protein [bacterium M00.F.Ca.ET.156.01.1.1]TGU47574.1 GtrA family protein [bacterium M00.F.Ca.ET.146.01.1.1]TGV69719.1 GtrA family protein [Mesorhizo
MGTAETGVATWKSDLILALLAALLALAIDAWSGFGQLTDPGGDNDNMLRLVEVRDLLAGQGWFDLHQYRMGLEGGFVMHWSRLVDAPIAAIVLVASALTGSKQLGEDVAQVLWPALLLWSTLFFTARAARSFGGGSAVLPAILIGGAGCYFIGIYDPGALDHHNVQLMLTMASLALLLEAPSRRWAALFSGLCAALTLAIGMETVPYVATIGVCVTLLFVADADGERAIAWDFGLGFASVAALVFVATIPPSAWGAAQCDAFSVAQFAVAAIAGIGLAAIASIEPAAGSWQRRLASVAALGVILGVVVVALFPQCLAAPYASLDPRLKELWLDHIDEAQSLFTLLVRDPTRVAARYATPLVAIILMALRFRRGGWRRQDSLVAALLIVAFVVAAWQVRGTTFSIAFAVIPLAAWIAKWRARAEASPSLGVALRLAAVWLVSINPVWTGVAAAASVAFDEGKAVADGGAMDKTCEKKATFAPLGAMAGTTVLTISNLGAPVLLYGGHRVFAGPYHRNVDGNLMALDAFLGSADDARAIVEAHRVGLVAICPGNVESQILTRKAPQGFLAGLLRGSVPDWLEPVSATRGGPLELYRVRLAG